MPSPTEVVEVRRASTIPNSGRWNRCRVKDRVIPVSDTSIKSHFTIEGSPEVFTREDYGRTWRWSESNQGLRHRIDLSTITIVRSGTGVWL